MRIHLAWLSDFVELPSETTALCEQLVGAGLEVEEVVALQDGGQALELSVSPNRGDLLSHLGVAREVAAHSGKRLGGPKWRLGEQGADVALAARLIAAESKDARRFAGRVVHKLAVGPSPGWLVSRLTAIGQRSVNNVVDATNYVMHELGQPLHAYDLDALHDEQRLPTLRVRMAEAGERLVTLDGKDRTLSAQDLIIADGKGPVALAGVMGGRTSEVTHHTRAVLLEAGAFAPTLVRQSARRHGIRTEASVRFERGVDATQLTRALDRCAQLLAEVAGGEVAKGVLDAQVRPEPPRELQLRLARLEQLLGIALTAESVVQLLDPLELRCRSRRDETLVFEVPSFRSDIEEEVDLIEEVARRYGYDRLAERLPDTRGDTTLKPLVVDARQKVRDALLGQGVSEAVSFALTSPEQAAPFVEAPAEPVRILNPLGHTTSVLRTSLMPHLLDALSHNLRRGQRHVRLFEVGEIFVQLHGKSADLQAGNLHTQAALPPVAVSASLPHEEERVAAVLEGERHAGAWYGGGAALELPDIVGLVDAAVVVFDVACALRWRRCTHPYLAPGQAAELVTTHDGHEIVLGWAGRLADKLASARELPKAVFVCELRLGALRALPTRAITAQLPPKTMGTRRDLALIAGPEVEVEALRTFIAQHAGGAMGQEVVARVWVFDRYVGKSIPKGHTSYGIAILYQRATGQLTDSEVNEAYTALFELLHKTFGVTQRGAS